jgi:hypothetical protein
MPAKDDSLGTALAARLCRLSVRSVTKLMDSQSIRSWKVGPTHTQRRSTLTAVREYLEAHGMPTDLLDDEVARRQPPQEILPFPSEEQPLCE